MTTGNSGWINHPTNFSKYLEGSSKLFRVFDCDMGENTAFYENQTMILFDGLRRPVGKIGITAAISKDTSKESNRFNILIKKVGKLYIPDEKYISTDTIPDVWLEIWKPNYTCTMKEHILDSSEELDAAYDPTLNEE